MSNAESDHGTKEESPTGEEDSDTNIYSSKSDLSSEEGSLVDTDKKQRNTGAGEGTHDPRQDADSIGINTEGGENIEAPVQKLGEASETKKDGSNTGHIIGEAAGKLGVRSTHEGVSKWDDDRRKEGKEPVEDEGQDKPLSSPSEMQGKPAKPSHL